MINGRKQWFHSNKSALLTSIHDQVPSDLRLPVVPGRLEALGEADAEVLEVAFAHEGLGGAGGDQRALNGQDQSRARVKVYGVVGLWGEKGEKKEKWDESVRAQLGGENIREPKTPTEAKAAR